MSASKSPPRKSRKPPPTSTSDPVLAYARDVLARGRDLAGPWVRLACQRHLDDLEHGHERGLVWSLDHALYAIDFFATQLKLNAGKFEGRPFVLLPWEAFCIGSLFGWLKAATMTRRFRTGYMEIGKGNGKSPLAAGIGLLCLTSDQPREPRAEVYAAASKKDQAMILFRDAVAMVDQSPALRAKIVKTGGRACWNLGYNKTASFFRCIASDDSQSGPRPHCALIDELHEHTDDIVCDMLDLGQKFRTQPLTIKITNSGFDKETVCYRDHEYSLRVMQGEADDDWFAYVCALDEGDKAIGRNKDTMFSGRRFWIKTNPSLGHTIDDTYVETLIRKAIGMPAMLSKVRRFTFCEWVGAEHPWIEPELWLQCQHEFDWVAELLSCDHVDAAIDLSGVRDLTSLTLSGKRLSDGMLITHNEFWTPLDTMEERARLDKLNYPLWVQQGHLVATPGKSVDYAWVARRLGELATMLPLYRCCFDPYRIPDLERELDAAEVEIELIAHPQGGYRTQPKLDKYRRPIPSLWMPRSIELLAAALVGNRIRCHRNPVLNACSASAVQTMTDDKGNLIFNKRKSRGRIDGVVTLAMAVGLLESGNEDDSLAALLGGKAIV